MRVLVSGGRVVTGASSEPIEAGYVILGDGEIAEVGSMEDLAPTARESCDRVVDATGKTVMPGLVSAHEHMDDRRSFGGFQERMERPSSILLLGAAHAALACLREGITTVRDCGGVAGNSVYVRDAIELGLLAGPRVRTCVAPIGRTGGYGTPLTLGADGPVEVRKRARQVLAQGADFVKCMASEGVASGRLGDPGALQMTDEELAAAVDEAHRAGKRATVHAHPSAAIRQAVECGVDSIEHGLLMDDECAALMAERGVFLISTLSEPAITAEDGARYRRPALQSEATLRVARLGVENFGRAVRAGVKVAMGVDVLGTPARELALMVEAGMTPMAALQAATHGGAELLGLEATTGSLAPGMSADLIVLADDPLEDVGAIDSVETVVARGRVMTRAAIEEVIGVAIPGYRLDHGRLLSPSEYR
jgi:imidazolonepropionase-like amidohydrolase